MQFVHLTEVICALLLCVMVGCRPHENADLRNFLEPTPTGRPPESPYTLSGTIIESGAGNPLANVLVDAVARTTLTNESGYYEFLRLGSSDVSFSREGFEAPGPYQVSMTRPLTLDASMQRVIRASANQVVSAVLFPNDPFFHLDDDRRNFDWLCGPPCKVVRVAVPVNGRLRVRVAWQPSSSEFDLILLQRMGPAAPRRGGAHGASGELSAELPVTGGADALVYFGLFQVDQMNLTKLPIDLQFSLTTSMSP